MFRNALLICLPRVKENVYKFSRIKLKNCTFWNIYNEKRAKNSWPADGVDARLNQASIDADINESERQDDEDHDVLSILPEQRLLAEEKLVSKTKHEKPQTKNLNSDLKIKN